MTDRRLETLPIGLVHPRADQPREEFDPVALEELAESIRQHGLQSPITVRPDRAGFEIMMGERRYRAHQLLGSDTIDAFVVDEQDDDKAFIIAVIENVVRRDLNPLEEGKAYDRMTAAGLSVREVAEKIGRPVEHVNAHIEMLGCRPEIQKLVARGDVAPGFARQLARLSPDGQMAVLRYYNSGRSFDEVQIYYQNILAREAQRDIFADIEQLTPDQVKAGRVVRQAVDLLARVTEQLGAIKPDDAAVAIAHDGEALELKIQIIQQAINRLLTTTRRAKVIRELSQERAS